MNFSQTKFRTIILVLLVFCTRYCILPIFCLIVFSIWTANLSDFWLGNWSKLVMTEGIILLGRFLIALLVSWYAIHLNSWEQLNSCSGNSIHAWLSEITYVFFTMQRIWIVLGRCLFSRSVQKFAWFLKSSWICDFGLHETGNGAKEIVVLRREFFFRSNFKVERENGVWTKLKNKIFFTVFFSIFWIEFFSKWFPQSILSSF